MYIHTLNYEENKRNVVPFYEHSVRGAEESGSGSLYIENPSNISGIKQEHV